MRLEFSTTFDKALKRLPKDRVKRIQTMLQRFIANPNLPSLRLHKLEGLDVYSISSSRKDRVILEKTIDNKVTVWTLLDVGPHDQVYRRTNRR